MGEDTWFSEKQSEFPSLVMNPGTYRQGWKPALTDTLKSNTSFIDWVFEKLEPPKDKVRNYVDMTMESQTLFGEAVVGCTYRKKVTVSVPKIKFFYRTEVDGWKGATFQPVLEEPERQQVVHLCMGDYMKLLDVMKKKLGPGKGIEVRLVYADPPWGFHSTTKGARSEDEHLEPPERVSIYFNVNFHLKVTETSFAKVLYVLRAVCGVDGRSRGG